MRALLWSFPTILDLGPQATLCALLGVLPCPATAQEAVISGKVTGTQGERLAGAIVAFQELNLAVSTNSSGMYAVTIGADRVHGQPVTVRVGYIGYASASLTLTLTPGTQAQDFQLAPDPFRLTEVVVTGTAAPTERKDLTFSAPSIDVSQLQEAPGVNALSGLGGKAAGVRALQANGEPGSAPKIRLRAATSLTGTFRSSLRTMLECRRQYIVTSSGLSPIALTTLSTWR